MTGVSASAVAAAGSVRDLPFVGREAQLAALVSAVQAAELGEPVVALVAGEPGIGKTRLVRELAARVSARVVRAACWEGQGAPAYWVWLQVLRALPEASDVTRLLREPHGESDSPFWVFDAVTEVMAGASEQQPLLVVVEDLHDADEASLRLLEFFQRDPRPRRVAVVATYRDTDLDRSSPLAQRLAVVARDGLHLVLSGLAPREVDALLRTLGVDLASVDAGVLRRRSGGNPLFLRELVALAGTDGPLADTARTVPAGVRSVVERRLARLSESAREVLAAAAVAGPDVDVALLAAVTGRSERDLLAALDEARTAGLVAEVDAEGMRFVHALLGEVLYQGLSLPARSELHQRFADAVEQRYGDERLPQVAHHVLRSPAGGGQRGVDVALRAAEHSAGVLAYEQAASWYGRAVDLVRSGRRAPVDEDELLVRRGEAELAAGDLPAARTSFIQAAAIARVRGDADQLARAALGLGTGFGGFEVKLLDPVQVELLEEALAALDPAPSVLRACTLARLSVALSFMDADDRRSALCVEAVDVARAVGEPAVLGYALTGHCDAIPGPDFVARRLLDATEAVRLAERAGDRRLELLARRLRLVALLESGEVAAADVEIERFARVAARVRQPLYRWYVPLWRGMRDLMRGDLRAAARSCAEAEEVGALAQSENARMLTFTQWWVRRRYEGEFADAGAAMGRVVEPSAVAPGPTPAGWPYPAVVALQTGDGDRARLLLEQWLASGLEQRPRDSEWLPESAQLAQAAVLVGAHDVAAVLYEQLRPYAHLYCVEGIGAAFTGSVAWYLAELAGALGRGSEAEHYARLAADAHRQVGLVGGPPPLAASPAAPQALAAVAPTTDAALVWEGATWAASWGGETRRLRDSKGLRDLVVLLSRPGEEVHCLELMGGTDVGGDAGPGIDQQARRAYEQRIRDLQEDIDEAHADNDLARAERAEAELDVLVQQLSQAFGLSGRPRATGSAAERARSAVGWRVRAALRAAAEVHPVLARHLQNAVRTGTWCTYRPEVPVRWTVQRAQGRSA